MRVLFSTLCCLLLATNTATFADEFAEPDAAVRAYITAVSTGSGEHIQRAFADNAEIQYYDQNGRYQFFTRDDFAAMVGTGNNWDARIEITHMLKTGKAANATVEFTWGKNDEHGYIDYLNLIHTDGSWRITNKVAQYFKRN